MEMAVDPAMIPPGYISQFSIGSVGIVRVIQCQYVRNNVMLIRGVVSQIMFVSTYGYLPT